MHNSTKLKTTNFLLQRAWRVVHRWYKILLTLKNVNHIYRYLIKKVLIATEEIKV
jgi:hypothetical protein